MVQLVLTFGLPGFAKGVLEELVEICHRDAIPVEPEEIELMLPLVGLTSQGIQDDAQEGFLPMHSHICMGERPHLQDERHGRVHKCSPLTHVLPSAWRRWEGDWGLLIEGRNLEDRLFPILVPMVPEIQVEGPGVAPLNVEGEPLGDPCESLRDLGGRQMNLREQRLLVTLHDVLTYLLAVSGMGKPYGKKLKKSSLFATILFSSMPSLRTNTRETKDPWLSHEEGQLALDVLETRDSIVLRAPIAGVSAGDVDVSVTPDMVTIRGARSEVKNLKLKGAHTHIRECHWGAFSRSVVLPTTVRPEGAKASLKNGILTITLPKTNHSSHVPVLELTS